MAVTATCRRQEVPGYSMADGCSCYEPKQGQCGKEVNVGHMLSNFPGAAVSKFAEGKINVVKSNHHRAIYYQRKANGLDSVWLRVSKFFNRP